ncbi:aspartate-semialdehyde dehydrogenase [candidate division TA06 bacterium DG_78]|uniref:Aspartate-semialdehyde dehydrogenase n=1 Tax=candidate division TA06 bacterium DG_78 TaxID=1703772 RepID=A0A0S7YIJ3_UNCT6|nr:MAG: aspartate-semialdehyde dehydrogenase [candidate division TA06 bacterium DG_78]
MTNIAVLGATGLVGLEVIKILEQRNFPAKELFLFASEKSEGSKINFKDQALEVLSDYETFIDKAAIVFGCLDEAPSREVVPRFREKAVVIDNSKAFRMDPDVPLVVPEINPEKIKEHKGIIANPNCSTIQMLLPLFPLHKEAQIKRIFVATYQSVSGYGRDAVDELKLELEYCATGQDIEKFEENIFPYPIADNIIPQIGAFNTDGYTSEEMKMLNETRKILDDDSIHITATCVRIPIVCGHSEAVSVEFENPISVDEAKEILQNAPGVKVLEEDENYPMPIHVVGKDDVFVGRVRRDLAFKNGLAMWIVADNVRKGAALNAVQIAELL